MCEKISILIIDQYETFQESFNDILNCFDDFELVGVAQSKTLGIQLTAKFVPDIILIDLDMIDQNNGDKTINRIYEISPASRIIVRSSFNDNKNIFSALKAGARSNISKNAEMALIGQKIRRVAEGEFNFSAPIADLIFKEFNGLSRSKNNLFNPLSDQEMDILNLMKNNNSINSIAHKLKIASKKVYVHINNIIHKLHKESVFSTTFDDWGSI